MNKLISFLIFAIITTTSCQKDQAPDPTIKSLPFENADLKMEVVSSSLPSQEVWDMHFFNESTGIVITNEGEIYKTTDKGITWVLKYTNPTPDQPLFQILFVDQNTGYAVGGANWCNETGSNCPGGLVLKTTDGGETWTNIFQVAGQTEFDAIAANTSGDLFLIANGYLGPAQPSTKILKSSDAGINWTAVDSGNIQIVKITFSENYGFCIEGNGSQKIIRSNDNGNTWNNTLPISEHGTSDIAFINNIGYCIADNSVYKTIDNGDNWIQVYPSSGYNSNRLNPLTENSCLLWGSGKYSGGDWGHKYGAVRQTINAGNDWTDNQFNDLGVVRCSSFYSSSQGYILNIGFGGVKLIKVTVQ